MATRKDLAEYRRKRDFERTAEPPGGEGAASPTGRLYVLQKHAARNLHYDLRLEFDGVLRSWAVPKGPSLDPAQKTLAVEVEDHPIEYATFEGAIPKGEYGGGTVMLWDYGQWEPIGDAAEGYRRGDLKFRLNGQKLRGAWVLVRMDGKGNESGRNWLLIKKKDDAARPLRSFNVLAELPYSVASGRTMEEIASDPRAVWADGKSQPVGEGAAPAPVLGPLRAMGAGRPSLDPSKLLGAHQASGPETLAPQLATPAQSAPEGDQWLHEIKLDGYRLIGVLREGRARLLTRNGHDWTERMPAVAEALARLPIASAIVDGEVVILDGAGISDFQALQNAFRRNGPARFTYSIFDVPHAAGWDLTRVPLLERKKFLADLLRAAPLSAPVLQFCDHVTGRGGIVFEEAKRAGLEGIISKRADSAYEPGRRTSTWLKVKATLREEFVIVGYAPPSAGGDGVGSLLLGQYEQSGAARRLVYRGRVGTGFTQKMLAELHALLRARARREPPVANPQADPEPGAVHWVEPTLVAEVEFNGWTDDDVVRQASFKGLREDRDPREIVRESVRERPKDRPAPRAAAAPAAGATVESPRAPGDAEVAGVRISHPLRPVYPEEGVTKVEVARYYEAVASWMLPLVAKRPLSLVRCPQGLAGESFYQRQLGEGFPEAIRPIDLGEPDSEGPGMYIQDVAGLVSLVQMGVLEIHPWGARIDNLEKPDQLVFDLDPGPGIAWADVVASAKVIGEYLDGLGLTSFVKTSGGKGMHIVVPIARRAGWDEVKEFAGAVSQAIVRIAPRNFVATMSKARREQRVFIDYFRNHRGSTSVAAYSTRARPGATVSTPLRWDELPAAAANASGPGAFTVRSVPERLTGMAADPWAGYHDLRQSITAAMKRAVSRSPPARGTSPQRPGQRRRPRA